MGRSYCGGISARGTSLLEDHEVGGRRVDVRNTKKASVAEEQSVKERERRGKSLGHPQVLLYPCKDRGFYQPREVIGKFYEGRSGDSGAQRTMGGSKVDV